MNKIGFLSQKNIKENAFKFAVAISAFAALILFMLDLFKAKELTPALLSFAPIVASFCICSACAWLCELLYRAYKKEDTKRKSYYPIIIFALCATICLFCHIIVGILAKIILKKTFWSLIAGIPLALYFFKTVKCGVDNPVAVNFIAPVKKKTSRLYLVLAFTIPCILMYAIYFLRDTYPFGDESVLVLDLNAQYVYFFNAFRRVLHGDASLFYSFSRALGGEFIGIFAYYLSSPLSWIVALFPEDMMLEALLVLFTTKCGLCGLTMAWYLDSHNIGSKTSRILFGILYALCGYGVIYQHNTMWIDCMYLLPLIALGIENLISKRKYLLFTLSLALAVFSNFYIGFMMCIFCLIYYFYAAFCVSKNETGEILHHSKAFLRMGFFSVIAVGLAACIILPTYYSLGFGKTTFTDPTYDVKARFDFLDLAGRFFLGSYDTVRPEGLPIVYCGMLTLILVPLFFISKKTPLRQKIGTGALITIFIISFSIDSLDKYWHGMQAPNWLNYRYSFMLVFILLVAAAKALSDIKHIKSSHICAAVGGWMIVLFIFQKVGSIFTIEEVDRDIFLFIPSFLFLIIYASSLAVYHNKKFSKAASSILIIFVCMEMGFSGLSSIKYLDHDVVYSTRSSYHNNKIKFEDSADYILSHDDSFYRFDKTQHPLINTPMMLGIRGFTNSTSTLNEDTINFLRYMGLSSKSHWSKYYGGTAPFDSFLGVKYVIATPEYTVPDGYSPVFFGNSTTVYQNPNALSVAYAVNSSIKDVILGYPSTYADDIKNGLYEEYTAYYTPPQRMNVMMGAMLGEDSPVEIFKAIEDVKIQTGNASSSSIAQHHHYAPINTGSGSAVYYDFVTEAEGILYMYIPSDYPREASVLVNGVDKGTVLGNETNRMITLGTFEKGTDISVSLVLKADKLYIREDLPYFWYVDTEVYEESFAKLSENQFIIEEWSDTEFIGKITTTSDRSTVFTSIPYDKNWKVYVDGKEVKTFENLQALVAFDTEPGEHSLVIKYVPQEFYTGLIISVGCALVLIAVVFFDLKLKKRNAESAGTEASNENSSQGE